MILGKTLHGAHIAFTRRIWTSEQRVTFALYSINRLVLCETWKSDVIDLQMRYGIF